MKGGITERLQSCLSLSFSHHKWATDTLEEIRNDRQESFIFDVRLSLEIFSERTKQPPDYMLWVILKQICIL